MKNINTKKNKIEEAVSAFYKVSIADLYDKSKNDYPLNAARSVLMYLLYEANVYKLYDFTRIFDYKSQRTVEIRIASVAASIHKGIDKIADDVKAIKEKLNKKIK